MSNLTFMEKLLNGIDVEWKVLGEVAVLYGGLTGKSKSDFENGNTKFVSYKNIFNNIEVPNDELSFVKVSSSENSMRSNMVMFCLRDHLKLQQKQECPHQ